MRWQFFPHLAQHIQICLHRALDFLPRNLVCLREDDGKRHSVLPKELEEIEVFLLGFVAYVDEDEEAEDLMVFQQMLFNQYKALSVMNEYSPIQTGGMPKTGARGVYAIVAFGAFAITIAGVALLIYRKKLQTVNIYAVKGSEKKKE